ncbi:MAG: YbaB/EbfC family nucleoid-associated protein [Candidatus Latescibacteria bacterium]|jgi:nucleoid-associated protein EbfC|nr:YbaB/EbfC family nucleoid-associated protein [Candidatus Latescibacterota bacterium]MBT4139658.1 YbaB/EbfC family nucleoid-associated protein [Candidatus Latescibacterota bacterium]MBT5830695.1 YbaB/EbfC family nucleoid-associated protein [Candidatus Latescibacterota bacterium]
MAKGMGAMMKQAQKLQAKLAKVQDELGGKMVEGTSGGGMVVVVANGHQEILSVKIKPEVVDPEDVEMLEDLIMAAIQQAKENATEMSEAEMQKATEGLIPPGMNIPGLI